MIFKKVLMALSLVHIDDISESFDVLNENLFNELKLIYDYWEDNAYDDYDKMVQLIILFSIF